MVFFLSSFFRLRYQPSTKDPLGQEKFGHSHTLTCRREKCDIPEPQPSQVGHAFSAAEDSQHRKPSNLDNGTSEFSKLL